MRNDRKRVENGYAGQRFAPVAPIHILNELLNQDCLGNYHLVLAHDVVKHPAEYRSIFNEDMTIILDNSLIELGSAADVGVVKEAYDITGATCIVLPDLYLDSEGTLASIATALPTWRKIFPDVEFMYVPQGKTLKEFAWCAFNLKHVADGDGHSFWWGIPKNLESVIGTRRDAIEVCHMLDPAARKHLLGFSDNFIDDAICARDFRISGIDSAVPLRVVNQDVEFSLSMQVPRRGDWWDSATYTDSMEYNIKQFRRWIND